MTRFGGIIGGLKSRGVAQFVSLLVGGLLFSLVVGSLIHEGTHVLLMQAGGSDLKEIVIMPGIQLYPRLAKVKWSGYVAGISLSECPSEFFAGLCLAMGSSSNAIASYLLLVIITITRRGRRKEVVLLAASLVLAWGLIGYSFFPLLGLRHWIFVGGDYAEPIKGASMIGVPLLASYLIVGVHVVVYHFAFAMTSVRVAKDMSTSREDREPDISHTSSG
jgi:hypothetical protein